MISLASFVESRICDGRTSAMNQSYPSNRSRSRAHALGVGLFGGILYLRQQYDNRQLVIHQLYGNL